MSYHKVDVGLGCYLYYPTVGERPSDQEIREFINDMRTTCWTVDLKQQSMKYKVIKKYPGGPELNAIVPERVKLKGGVHSVEAKDWPEFFAPKPYVHSIDVKINKIVTAWGPNFGNMTYTVIHEGVPTEFQHSSVRFTGHADSQPEAKVQCEQAVLRFLQENKIISHV